MRIALFHGLAIKEEIINGEPFIPIFREEPAKDGELPTPIKLTPAAPPIVPETSKGLVPLAILAAGLLLL